MDPPVSRETLTADGTTENEAFQLLSDPTRVAILRALWAQLDTADPPPLRFSELRNLVDIEDPGRLNYHLNKLVAHFMRRTEAGYELRESGKRIIRVLLSGTILRNPAIDPVRVDTSCWYCGG